MQSIIYADEPFNNRSAHPFPDLLLLDLQMPVMDGFEVLAAVKGRIQFPCLPIVVLSSNDDPVYIQEALHLGATDFLIKPITMEDRINMVRKLHSRWLKDIEKPALGRRTFNSWAIPSPEQIPKKSL